MDLAVGEEVKCRKILGFQSAGCGLVQPHHSGNQRKYIPCDSTLAQRQPHLSTGDNTWRCRRSCGQGRCVPEAVKVMRVGKAGRQETCHGLNTVPLFSKHAGEEEKKQEMGITGKYMKSDEVHL